MDLGNMVQQILSTIGDFINNALGMLMRLFDSLFSFLPANLRVGAEVLLFIIVGAIIFFLWKRD
jgi:hypothetical protein